MHPWENEVREEHEALKSEIGALQTVLNRRQAGERQEALCGIVRIVGPDLELHLKKEEEVLFPALQRLLGKELEALDLLKGQHQKLRAAVRDLAGLLCGCQEPIDWERITQVGQAFVQLLEEHERKEDRLLIEVLQEGLKPQELMELARGFQRVVWKARQEGL